MKRLVLPVSFLLILVSSGAGAQDVVISRRVYATTGRSFQQLWVWSPDTGAFAQLTRSSRDHHNPRCSSDASDILFSSGDRRFRFDRDTGGEAAIENTVATSRAGGREDAGIRLDSCDDGTASRSHDGSRLACAVHGEEIAVVEVRSQRELERLPFRQRSPGGGPYPPRSLQSTWSPDAARLLVGTYGYGSSSSSAFLDYFVVDLATRRWTRAFSGNDAVWLADGRTIVFTTPRELTLLPATAKHVWTTQLAVFDLATGTVTALTSDVTNNEALTVCPAR